MKRWIFLIPLIVFAFHGLLMAEGASSRFRAELLGEIDDVGKKLVELAEAVPEEKYAWRPAEGVRSVSEVYMHVAAGNFYVLKLAGIEPGAGLPADPEKSVTKKPEVIESLKKSLEHISQALSKATDADLDEPADFFGQKTTARGIFLRLDQHMHEHLGQSIAYARINGIVPPWSRNQ